MLLLAARDLSRQFDFEPVFSHVTFDVRAGDKIGLVGPNGVGKSTLMHILAGDDDPDVGTVERSTGLRYSLLEQQTEFPAGRTVLEEAKSGLGHLYALQAESVVLAERIATETDPVAHAKSQKRYDFVQHELLRQDAYQIDHRVDEVLLGLGFTPDLYDRPLATLSGGQQNRVLLARLLLSTPDLLLLDEPTNHLDIATTEWLEGYLASSSEAMIIVSHDRYFLDKVTNRILELNRGSIADYPGNFSAYWKQRAERMVVQQRTFEKQQEEIADLQEFIIKNRYGQKHAQAADRVKKLERIERIERPTDFTTAPMGFGAASRTGDWVIDANRITKGFGGDPLFSEVTLRINRGDRVGIFGPNGSGKTTLLKTLLGQLPPDSGQVRSGTGVEIGYFDQQLFSVSDDDDCIEAIRPPDRPELTPGQLRDYLARFGLKGDIVFQKVGTLSGGERSKVALSKIAVRNVNLLILDEPTNHLDLWACASLESSLKDFNGTLLFVSHDRYFLDRVATHVLAFDGVGVKYYEGNYSAYLDSLRRRAEEAGPVRTAVKATEATTDRRTADKSRRKRKFPYRKVEDIEADIAEHEALVERLQADMASPEVLRNGDLTRQTLQQFEAARATLAQLYEHWEEAIELA